MKRDLYLVVESSSDFEFWRKQMSEHFPHLIANVHNLRNGDAARQFNRIVEDAFEGCYGHVVFLIDEDASPRPDSKLQAVLSKHRELGKQQPVVAERVTVFGVRRRLEAWLLADEVAILAAFAKSRYRRKTITDTLVNPKREARAVCERHYGKTTAWSEVQFARQMACKVDFHRAAKWSQSLGKFWREAGPYLKKPGGTERS